MVFFFMEDNIHRYFQEDQDNQYQRWQTECYGHPCAENDGQVHDDHTLVRLEKKIFERDLTTGSAVSRAVETGYSFVKASKRGNDVYCSLMHKKFREMETLPEVPFFIDDYGRKKTKLLFLTFTYGTKYKNKDGEEKEKDPVLYPF